MHYDRRQDDASICRITWVGLWGNLGLAIIKTATGLLGGSLALVADGFHSFSDLATDIAVIFGVYFGGKAPDHNHPYGHGRIETFSAAFVAAALALVGVGMIYKAGRDIAQMHLPGGSDSVVPGMAVFTAAILSIGVKEALYQWTRRVAIKTHSTALYANAWHHRSDALSSIAVLAGALAVRLGYAYGDPLAALAVALMIILVAVRIIGDCFSELSERAVDRQTLRQIENVIQSDERICQWHRLRTRSVGREIFIDLHILVEPQLNIAEAHRIADTLESNLHEQIPRPINVIVHVEPDLPELRR
ncbi:MAG TPA: cation transporter [Phycisphaerales bacterium]|nr:cation transporter [Phycisphaerales bacterium]